MSFAGIRINKWEDNKMETMDDYKDELEASFRRINEGDIISGTVIDVNEEEVTLDLKYYAQGIIKVASLATALPDKTSFSFSGSTVITRTSISFPIHASVSST